MAEIINFYIFWSVTLVENQAIFLLSTLSFSSEKKKEKGCRSNQG
ncbi:hypothetical protein FCR2A7T_22810 [Flavobacterium cauense R2A-7]|nr:hypothetical protein FCR2A7T_22810 [Flavobacterium cauense R2A-7]